MAPVSPDKWLSPHRTGGSAAREYSHFPDETSLKELAAGLSDRDNALILSELDDEEKLKRILGRDVAIYKGKNGMMTPLGAGRSLNIGNALKVRGVEADKAIVILDVRISFKNNKVTGSDDLKRRYRILLTRGLRECYIYVMDEKLREHMINALNNEK